MNYNKVLKRRICCINIIFLCITIFILGRLAYIQLGYKSTEYVSMALDQYNLQYRISNLNYRILDDSNEDLINYNEKYIVEIKSNIFKNFNNNIEMEKILSLISILKNYDNQFDLIKKFDENPSYNFKFEVDKHTYDKLRTLDEINGVYLYKYNQVNEKEAWSVENVLIREIQEKSTDNLYHEYMVDNKYPTISFLGMNYGQELINRNNNNLKLTINKSLQTGVEQIINNKKYNEFESIAVAISESDTGKIKVMTQKNESNPNIMLGSTTVGYVPGSIFKLVVTESALDLGIFTRNDTFDCRNSNYDLCQSRHGVLNIEEALAVSCNNTFAEIGKVVTWEYMLNYALEQGLFKKVFGFSDLREINGSYANPKEYEDGPLFLSMGQNMLIEPIQSLGIINTILNNGNHNELSIVDSIINEDGEIISKFNYKTNRVLNESTANSLKEMLVNTVKNGTGKVMNIENVEVGVKTGTTERFNGENYVSDGWVLGYFKHRNKYYSMCVFVENINEKGQYGGNTAGPIFKDIVEYFVKNF